MTEDYSSSKPLVPPAEVADWLDEIPRPVALTGGTGFVGSHLVDTLCAAGVRPRILVRDAAAPRWIAGVDADFVEGSLEDVGSLERLVAEAGTVIHLAGTLRAGREEDFDLGNRAGTANLVAAVRAFAPRAKFIQVSSLAAAGPSPDPAGVAPGDPPAPVSAYGRSKLAGEREVAKMDDERLWCILRPPAIFGPRDTDILEFFKMASRGIAGIPAGDRWLTMSYVSDIVRGVIAAAATGEHRRVYHLGEPAPVPLETVFDRLAAAGECRVRVFGIPAAVIRAAGLAGSGLQRLGWTRLPLTLDKTTELLARHWTAETASSLEALGLGDGIAFADGARTTWTWYRFKGWVR